MIKTRLSVLPYVTEHACQEIGPWTRMCVHVEVALTHMTLHDTVGTNLITKQANALMPTRSSRRGNPIRTHVTSPFSHHHL